MQKKRIAVVANTTWNIYNFRQNIIRKLVREGHEVIVMAPVDKYISYTEQIPEVQHVPIRHMRRNSLNPIQDLRLLAEFIRLYRKHKPDLILHYTVKCNIYGGFAAGMLRIPSVAVITGVGHPLLRDGWLNKLVTFLYRRSLPFHRKVIFENRDDKEMFDRRGLTRQEQSESVKGCGIDMEDFKPAPYEGTSDVVTFSFIGRLIYDKGVREFIEAAQITTRKYSQVQFWLVGDVDEGNPSSVSNEDLMYWIRDPAIHYHGATDNVKAYFRQTDCVVLPSYPAEGLPKVIMEAMAMERPVITTNTPGCREAVEDGVTGYLVAPKDAAAIAGAMERFILATPETRQRMGQLGRIKADREFNEDIIVEQLYAYLMAADAHVTDPATGR